jgi:hypothetical protein
MFVIPVVISANAFSSHCMVASHWLRAPKSHPAVWRSCHRLGRVSHLPSFLSSSLFQVSFELLLFKLLNKLRLPQLVGEILSSVVVVPALLPQVCLVAVGLCLLLAPIYV